MVKTVFRSVTSEQYLDEEGLQTVMCEVEAILNSRPLTSVSDNPNDLEPLTLNHLLQLKVQPLLPPGLFVNEDLYSRRRWRQVQYIADLFWKRWIQEYLPLLQARCSVDLSYPIRFSYLPLKQWVVQFDNEKCYLLNYVLLMCTPTTTLNLPLQ